MTAYQIPLVIPSGSVADRPVAVDLYPRLIPSGSVADRPVAVDL